MRKRIMVLTMALTGMLLSGAVRAESRPMPATQMATAVSEKTFEGNITEIDLKAFTFIVKRMEGGKPEEMKFHVGNGSKIMVDGQQILLGELQKGEHVTITYETAAGTHTAKHVKRHKAQ